MLVFDLNDAWRQPIGEADVLLGPTKPIEKSHKPCAHLGERRRSSHRNARSIPRPFLFFLLHRLPTPVSSSIKTSQREHQSLLPSFFDGRTITVSHPKDESVRLPSPFKSSSCSRCAP
ncbi:hypothetical protein MUK42_34106 [Musa troglodytarum]|uniref:Uncharacterized protein n=1 Tax=Musa troglodytarum TaxID=320322 RepID=A0A9E7GM37_9LILI|nr:hypothetical protein MUK42_34106 [Musa troglodytarum]